MRLYEFDNTDIHGYRIPRAKNPDNSVCWECGGINDLQPCGTFPFVADPICASCRKRFNYKWCDNCKINHINGVCPINKELEESVEKKIKWITTPGIMSPRGKFYPCKYAEHRETATKIIEALVEQGVTISRGDWKSFPVSTLLNMGYIRVERYPKNNEFSIQLYDLNKSRDLLRKLLGRLDLTAKNIMIEWSKPFYDYKDFYGVDAAEKFVG